VSTEQIGPRGAGRNEALDDALVPRLRVIEEQPLDQRATAYAQVHDQLKSRLEGSDSTGTNA
jgi:hypothetical protein